MSSIGLTPLVAAVSSAGKAAWPEELQELPTLPEAELPVEEVSGLSPEIVGSEVLLVQEAEPQEHMVKVSTKGCEEAEVRALFETMVARYVKDEEDYQRNLLQTRTTCKAKLPLSLVNSKIFRGETGFATFTFTKTTQMVAIHAGAAHLDAVEDTFTDVIDKFKTMMTKKEIMPMVEGTGEWSEAFRKILLEGPMSQYLDAENEKKEGQDKAPVTMTQTLTPQDDEYASLKRKPKRSLSRGFGSGRGTTRRPSVSPGPGSYDLVRVGDEVPQWSSRSLLPWGTRTGGRSQLVHSASDVGPGEYTAEQGMELGPTAKIGQKLQELPDSRINYPAPGHYPLGSTLCPKKPYKKGCPSPGIMGSGQRSTMSSKDDGPGFVYHPGVEPTTRAQFWSQGERKSWPKDEKQFRKMDGLLPADVPGPEYDEQKLSPDAYHPSTELVTYCAGVPKPMHRTAERRSIFDVAASHEGAAEALFKRALKGLGEDAEAGKSEMYESSGPSWSLMPRRPPAKKEEGCTSMYGPWSSIN
eukprot:g13693.t1